MPVEVELRAQCVELTKLHEHAKAKELHFQLLKTAF